MRFRVLAYGAVFFAVILFEIRGPEKARRTTLPPQDFRETDPIQSSLPGITSGREDASPVKNRAEPVTDFSELPSNGDDASAFIKFLLVHQLSCFGGNEATLYVTYPASGTALLLGFSATAPQVKVPSGNLSIVVAPKCWNCATGVTNVNIRPGKTVHHTVHLKGMGSVSGTVSDAAGRPLFGAEVTCYFGPNVSNFNPATLSRKKGRRTSLKTSDGMIIGGLGGPRPVGPGIAMLTTRLRMNFSDRTKSSFTFRNVPASEPVLIRVRTKFGSTHTFAIPGRHVDLIVPRGSK